MFKNIFTAAAVVLFASSVFAASSADSRSDNRSSARVPYASSHSDEGFFPSVGVGFGHMDQSGNSDVDGDAISAQIIGSYYFGNSNWIADAGLGFRKQYFKNTDAQPAVGLLSLDARYDFGNRYSAGPVADVLIGNGEDFGSSNKYLTMFGVVGLKEFTVMNDQMIRAGLKYTSEVGQNDQTSNFIGLVVEWGIGSQNSYVRSASAY